MVGLDPIGIEWDADACATRAAAGLRTVRADITQVATAPLIDRLDGLLFSPACQPFSLAGKRRGEGDKELIWRALDDLAHGIDSRAELTAKTADPRSLVVVEPLRFALACRPRWMVWEQVPPVLAIWQHCAHHLRDAGYRVWTGTVNAADMGVPQTRVRAILLASLDGPVARPVATHASDPFNGQKNLFGDGPLPRWVSMAEALGMNGVDRPARTVAGHRAPRWAYGVGNSYATGWTLRGSAQIAIEQAATLQSFPPDYPFQGTKTARFSQIGNAVPPLLAAHCIAAASGRSPGLERVA
jgi:DNA (cytosine-5)-methyltransferase 1